MALGFRVFTEIDRAPSGLIRRFLETATPDLADVMQRTGVVSGAVRPVYQPIPRIAGPAITVSLADGSFFNMLKIGMEMTRPGDVLVVAGRGNINYALLGGNVSKGLKHRGVAGAIVDGAVRDAKQIQAAQFPVHARGLAINAGPKEGPGEVNVPVAFGNCVIFPGDIIVADEEGIVAVPPAHAEAVLQGVKDLLTAFDRIQPLLERGEVTGIADIRRQLEASGCEFLHSKFG